MFKGFSYPIQASSIDRHGKNRFVLVHLGQASKCAWRGNLSHRKFCAPPRLRPWNKKLLVSNFEIFETDVQNKRDGKKTNYRYAFYQGGGEEWNPRITRIPPRKIVGTYESTCQQACPHHTSGEGYHTDITRPHSSTIDPNSFKYSLEPPLACPLFR